MIIGIYKVISPSNKIYIGQSTDINLRFNYYKRLACKAQIKLYNSLQKYGPENHQFEIIEECEENKLLEREAYWINFYNTLEEGLNCKIDGKGGKDSEETKKKKSISARNKKPRSLESKLKTSKALKGRPLSEEHKIKLRESKKDLWKNKIKSDKGKPKHTLQGKQNIKEKLWKSIFQFDLEGNFIKEYISTNHAAIEIKLTPSAITRNLRGRNKTAGGFIWRYKNSHLIY